MKIHRTNIRPIIEYGSIIYCSASKEDLKLIDSVTNEALRIITGVFKSTPISSKYILANEMPPDIRREYLTLKYFYKISSQINNHAFEQTVMSKHRLLFVNKHLTPYIAVRAQKSKEELHLRRQFVKPTFLYRLLRIDTPTYAISSLNVNTELSEFPKMGTTPQIYRAVFREVKSKYRQFRVVYTDGSKSGYGVGAAAVSDGVVKSALRH